MIALTPQDLVHATIYDRPQTPTELTRIWVTIGLLLRKMEAREAWILAGSAIQRVVNKAIAPSDLPAEVWTPE